MARTRHGKLQLFLRRYARVRSGQWCRFSRLVVGGIGCALWTAKGGTFVAANIIKPFSLKGQRFEFDPGRNLGAQNAVLKGLTPPAVV